MKVLDEDTREMQQQNLESETDTVQSVKSEIIKSLVLALQLEANDTCNVPDLSTRKEINFYWEVQRFEINLIKQALIRTKGNQRAAAKLLGLNATTLNGKIKLYNLKELEV